MSRHSSPALKALRNAREQLAEHTQKLVESTEELRRRRENAEDAFGVPRGAIKGGSFIKKSGKAE